MSFYPTFTDIYSKAIKNIEYHYGRESPQYLRYLEAINKHREYINKTIVNNLLDSLGVVSVRGYYYRIFNKVEQIDINNEPFEYWVQNRVLLLFSFQLLYKNLGEYENFNLSELGNYQRTIIHPSLLSSFEFSPNRNLLRDYSEDLEIFEPSQNLPNDFEYIILHPFLSSKIVFNFGTFITLPTYSFYELGQVKKEINDYWDENGVHIYEYEYFNTHYFRSLNSSSKLENQFLFFKINPNFDYDEYLSKIYKWKYVLTPNPVIQKCCLFDIFSKKTNQN